MHDLINGWTKQPPVEFNLPTESVPNVDMFGRFNISPGLVGFPGLFGCLKRIAAGGQFNDWLFVFGTAISASFPARSETNKGWIVDSTKMGEIYNTALIQRGGGSADDAHAYASRKRYIASIDFIKSQYRAKNFTLGDVVPADRLNLEPNESNREGSATFTINGINDKDGQPIMFGLEVCLDHAISTATKGQLEILRSRSPLWANNTVYAIGNFVISPDDNLLYTCWIAHTSSASPTTFTQDMNNNRGRWVPYTNHWGRIRTADKSVKIQLVPSGGMHLKPLSIRLLPAAGPTPHSYAFHCDGLTTLNSKLVAWGAQTEQEWGAHTQIWNGANGTDPVPRENQLINANYGQPVSNTSMAKVPDLTWLAGDTEPTSILWDSGSGYVRVMQEMPL